jgi:hypothetical protein
MPRYSNSVVYSTCGASAQSRLLLILFALPLRSLWHLLSYSVLMEHAHTHTTVLTLQVHHVSGQQGRLHHGDPRLREEDTEADDGVQIPQPAHQHRGDAQAAHRQVITYSGCISQCQCQCVFVTTPSVYVWGCNLSVPAPLLLWSIAVVRQ